MTSLAELGDRWRHDLASWAIPEEILSSVDTSPWTLPPSLFARRADEQLAAPRGPSYDRALEALPAGGSVLDVGAGAGAASLPLAVARDARIIAVDLSEEMLDELEHRAQGLGVAMTGIQGRWPDVADKVGPADVAVTKDVVYNVPDLPEFFTALTARAAVRTVVELTERHPLSPLNPLWLNLHGLRRPSRPSADDARAIAQALGLDPRIEHWTRHSGSPYATFAELVEVTRTRLCLPPARAAEVAAVLCELGTDPGTPRLPGTRHRPAATLWWPGRAG